jgi:outer membrane protein TolC
LRAGARPRGVIVAVIATVIGSAGAAPPLDTQPDRDLRRSIRETADRELAEAQKNPEIRRTSREARLASLGLKPEVLEELNKMAGPDSYAEDRLLLGLTLFDTEQTAALVTLEHAVKSSVNHNLNVQFARLAPAISQNQLAAAEAAFDWVFFDNLTWNDTDQPRTNQSINGSQVGVTSNQLNAVDNAIGVRKPLISGGQVTVQHQFIYTDNETPNLFVNPDPARETNVVLQLDQPLLRNFGSDVALAQVRLARNTERDEIQSLKATLLQTVNDTENAYWNLVRARNDLFILQRLLKRGEDVLDVLKKRFDANPANIASSASAVESRRADVIRGQRVLRDASDRLKTLINDPRWPAGGEIMLLPVDHPLDQPVEYSLIDAINTAFANRPEIQRAILSMDNTAIRQRAADNARLPQLNLRALTRLSGLGGSTHGAYDVMVEGHFVDYQIGLQFEMPIGNRGPEANFRVARLQRSQANIAYQNTLQQVSAEVKSSLRDVVTNYTLIEQQRVARIAATEDVRQLAIQESTTTGLTPDFLDLKLRRQQALAQAEQQENQALNEYAAALARFHAACGTALERNRILFEVPNIRPESRESDLFPDYSGAQGR